MAATATLAKPQGQTIMDGFASALGNTVYLGLYKSDIPVTDALTAADLLAIEADFDGYAGTTLVGGLGNSQFLEQLNAWTLQGWYTWTATGNTTPNTIYGLFMLTAATTGDLVAVQRFDTPQGVAAAGEGVNAYYALVC